jgi:DNA-binding CsgD family transcriptional regulator
VTGIAEYNRQFATVIDALGSDCFPVKLVGVLRQLSAIDDANIIFYPAGGLPVNEYSEPSEPGIEDHSALFLLDPFLLDPYYMAVVENRKFGFFHIAELVPDDFEETEYFETYFLNSGVHDGCCYLLSLTDLGFINIALGRIGNPEKFTTDELTLLESATPVIASLCRQHWRNRKSIESEHEIRPQLLSNLERFGQGLLTKRECQVISQVLLGYSSKTIAARFSISVETIKLHRKHAYAKLNVKTQAQLFHRFFESLVDGQ